MKLIVAGMLDKQVGLRLGISEITVKAHRGKMMPKMKADSIAELVKWPSNSPSQRPRNPWKVENRSD